MSAAGRVISFTLPRPTPLLNVTLRQHWSRRRKAQQALAWEVRAALGNQRPAQPFARARVRVERYSVGSPDPDGMVGGLKALLDCLLPPGEPKVIKRPGKPPKRVYPHPTGLSVIADDNPACLVLEPVAIRVSRREEQRTVVRIEELPAE